MQRLGARTTLQEFKKIIHGSIVEIFFKNKIESRTIRFDQFDDSDFKRISGFELLKPCPVGYKMIGQDEDPRTQHPLYPVFMAAIDQAMYGKGERHGGEAKPFLEQSWKHLADMHGVGFLTGQQCKKAGEAASCKDGDAYRTEVLGSLVYGGMAVLYHDQLTKVSQPVDFAVDDE